MYPKVCIQVRYIQVKGICRVQPSHNAGIYRSISAENRAPPKKNTNHITKKRKVS